MTSAAEATETQVAEGEKNEDPFRQYDGQDMDALLKARLFGGVGSWSLTVSSVTGVLY